MKKVLSIVLSIAMVLCMMPAMAFAGTATASQAAASYSDTVGTPCEGAVNVLHALGVVDGYTDGTYKPEQVVTRAEMAKLIVTALGVDKYATATTSKFTDMGAASWAIPYVEYASNLNIVNGYGYGLFGPNDTVTYEQAVTMIVRALGYTDECKEMNGVWPAIYVQKATALGIFDGVVNGGSAGADRGDVAIMLYNALDCAEVYADADGKTNAKSGKNNAVFNGVQISGVTMMGTLNRDGGQSYAIISSQDADTALVDIRAYVGAGAKVTVDKNGDVLAVGDIKTTFYTGDVSSDAKSISIDGKDYDLTGAKFVGIKATSGGADDTVGAAVITNGLTTNTTLSAITGYAGVDNVTIAAKISGVTVKEIYSIATWTVDEDAKVSESDVAQISKNCKLLGKEFNKNDEGQPDTATFILNGVDSLSDIKEDNIVYVYTNGSKIRRVDVGTEVVSGEITKMTATKATINGVAHKFSSSTPGVSPETVIGDWTAGDTIKAWLDYDGKIYDAELEEAGTSNYALVYSVSGSAPNASSTAPDAKIELITADGTATVFSVKGDKYWTNYNDNKTTSWAGLAAGQLVKYELNSANKITSIYRVDGNHMGYNVNTSAAVRSIKTVDFYDPATTSAIAGLTQSTTSAANYISKAGYLGSTKIADNATIFTLPIDNTTAFKFNDADDAGVTTLDKLKDSTPVRISAIVDDKGKIVAMVVSDEAASEDVYGVVTASYSLAGSKYGADFYVGTELKKDNETDTSVPRSNATSVGAVLYKIQQTAGDKYKMTSMNGTSAEVSSIAAVDASGAAVKIENGYVVDSAANGASLTTSKLSLYGGVVVYIYDESADEWTLGSKSDLDDDDNQVIKFYSTSTNTKDDNYGLVDYIVIYRL